MSGYCVNCTCHLDGTRHPDGYLTTTIGLPGVEGDCKNQEFIVIGDGKCDDHTNTPACDYDGGTYKVQCTIEKLAISI